MNFHFNEEKSLSHFLDKMCDSTDEFAHNIKSIYGTGQILTYHLHDDLHLYIFDFVLNQPLLIQWGFNDTEPTEYFLFHNISERIANQTNSDDNTLEHGAVIFTRNNYRRKLWLPNIECNLLFVHFSKSWFEKINKAISFPTQILENLKYTNNLYLNISTTSTSSLVTTLIRNHLDSKDEILLPYLEIKSIELIYLLFTDVLRNINTQKVKSSIHPNDLAKLNSFMGNIYSNIGNIPNIEEASKMLGMSMSKFQRIFKTIMGDSYYNNILRIKMDAGMEFLLKGSPVSEVAFKLGYSSIGNFTNVFKKTFNILPSEVLKSDTY